ncbi:hypothetical protein EAH68_10345 [Corynebacterium hylobatis]|uniref:Nuclear transport factor 2 family protein n=1 Tax=Corynebacterium hylobatis TaxID=1859290 RepID=A0A3S0BFK9_9CORY|nr:hypothetical protein [Corynebacterium hylobatis]RSZ62106.1 hypothetical protein EAH68_10345 [Corynebacterium hylobatis]
MTVKKTIAALALIAPLTFVAACGSGDSADETTTVAPTTVTSEITSEETTTEETTTEEETTGPEQTEEPEPEVEEPPAEDPLAQENYVESEPVQGGLAASESDRAEIEGLVHGIYEMDTFHQFLRYIPENTCHEVVAAQGGAASMDLAGIPDQPLAEWDYYVSAQPHIASVTDVQVEGDRASAVVTAVSAGQSETRTQRYQREDGRWKFCN